MIRSAVEYAIEVWSDLPHYINEKMENVWNRALQNYFFQHQIWPIIGNLEHVESDGQKRKIV